MINKRFFRKVNDKKILHKIGKRWVTISIAMLALLGGGAAASYVTHAASTTPVTKPAVNQPANNANSAKAKLVKPQSVSSSAKSQSASVSSSAVSGKSASSVSMSVASKSASSVSSAASVKSGVSNNKTVKSQSVANSTKSQNVKDSSSVATDVSASASNKVNSVTSNSNNNYNNLNPNRSVHNLGVTLQDTASNNGNPLTKLLNVKNILKLVNSQVINNSNPTAAKAAYANLINAVSYESLNSTSGLTASSGTNNWTTYLTSLNNDIKAIDNNNGNPGLNNVSSDLDSAISGVSTRNPTNKYTFTSIAQKLSKYSWLLGDSTTHDLASSFNLMNSITELSKTSSSPSIQSPQQNYDNILANLANLPNETKNEQIDSLHKISTYANNLKTQCNSSNNPAIQSISTGLNLSGLSSDATKAAQNKTATEIIQYKDTRGNILYTHTFKYSSLAGGDSQITPDDLSAKCPSGYRLINESMEPISYAGNTQSVSIGKIANDTIYYVYNGQTIGQQQENGGVEGQSFTISNNNVDNTSNTKDYNHIKGYYLVNPKGKEIGQETLTYINGSHNVDIAPKQNTVIVNYQYNNNTLNTYQFKGTDSHSVTTHTWLGHFTTYDVDPDIDSKSFALNNSYAPGIPKGYHLTKAYTFTFDKSSTQNIDVSPDSESENVHYSYGNKSLSSASISGGYYNAMGSVTSAPAGWSLSSANNRFTFGQNNDSVNVNVVPSQVTDTINYQYNNSTIGSKSFTGADHKSANNASGYTSNTFELTSANAANMPAGYHLSSASQSITYDGQSHDVPVTPNTITDTIKYQISNNPVYGSQKGSFLPESTVTLNDDRATSAGDLSYAITSAPSHYHIASGATSTFSHQTNSSSSSVNDVVEIVPNSESENVHYRYGSKSLSSSNVSGGYYNVAGSVTSAPSGWSLTSPSTPFTFGLNGDSVDVSVEPSQVTDVIHYQSAGTNIGNSATFSGADYKPADNANGYTNNTFNLTNANASNLLNGYHLSSTSQSITYDGQPHNVNVVPNSESVQIKYTDQNGHQYSGSINGVYGQSVNDVTTVNGNGLPNGYSVNNGQDKSYVFNNDSKQTKSLNITGNQQSGTVTVTIKKFNGTVSEGSYTRSVPESGETGNSFTIDPSHYAPAGYRSQSSVYNGKFTANGLNNYTVTFTYNAKAGSAITVNYVNQHGVNVGNSTITGNVDDTGSVNDKLNVPAGYVANPTQSRYRITVNQQAPITVHVTGKPVTYNGNVTLNYKYGNQTKSIHEPYSVYGIVGNQITLFNPNDYVNTTIKGFDTHHFTADGNDNNETFTVPTSVNGTVTNNDYVLNFTAQPVTDTIDYQYNGKTKGTTTMNGTYDTPGTADGSNMPNGWQLANGGSQNFTFNGKTNNVNVTPQSATDTINYQYQGNPLTSHSFTGNDVAASGANNTSFTIDSGNEPGIPANYQLVNGSQTFNYDNGVYNVDVKPNQLTDTINYQYDGTPLNSVPFTGNDYQAHGADKTSFTIDGSHESGMPAHYHLVNASQMFNYDGQAHAVDIAPDQTTDTVNYQYQGTPLTHATFTGNSVSAPGAKDTSFTVDGSHEPNLPTGYHLSLPSQTFDYNGQTYNVSVVPNRETDTVHFVNGAGHTVGSTTMSGLYGKTAAVTNVPAHYHVTGNDQIRFNGGQHPINVAIDCETATVNYMFDGTKVGTDSLTGDYGSTAHLGNVPFGYKLPNGTSSTLTLTQNQVVPVRVVSTATDHPATGATGSLIGMLLNATKDLKDPSSVNSYKDLVNMLNKNNVSRFAGSGINIGSATDTASNNTWLGYINSGIKDINNIASHNPNDSNLNNLASKLNSAKGLINNNSAILGLFSNTQIPLSFIGVRFSNRDGSSQTAGTHGMVQTFMHIPESEEYAIGDGVNTLSTVVSNSRTKNDYGNVMSDLAQLPGQKAMQKSQLLNDIAKNLDDIVRNTPSIGGTPRSGQVLNELSGSEDQVIGASQNYVTDPQYRDTYTVNYVNGSQSLGSKQLTGVDGEYISHDDLDIPKGYNVNSSLPTRFTQRNQTSQISLSPITDVINYQYQGQTKGSHQFVENPNGNSTLSVDNSNDAGLPSGYQLVDPTNSFNYDNQSHNVAITPIQKTDLINYQDQGQTKGNYQFTGNAQVGDTTFSIDHDNDAGLPYGYQLVNPTSTFSYDGGTHNVAVTPIHKTDLINYQYQGQTKGHQSFGPASIFDTLTIDGNSAGIPQGYHIDTRQTFAYDGGTYNVAIERNTANQITDTVYYVIRGTDHRIGSATMTRDKDTSAPSTTANMPYGYQLADDSTDTIHFGNSAASHNANVVPETMTDHVQYMYNGNQIGSTKTPSGAYGTPITLHAPANYHVVGNRPTFSGNQDTVQIVPDQKTDTVHYQANGHTKASQQFTGNDYQAQGADNTSFDVTNADDARIPSGYQLVNADNHFVYDGGTYNVAIEPIRKTDTIDYQYQGHTKGSHSFSGNAVIGRTAFNVTNGNDAGLPNGYQLVNTDNNFSYDGQPHAVAITPIQKTDMVNYMNGTDNVGHQRFSGNDVDAQGVDNTSFDASSNVPNGYEVVPGADHEFNYDGHNYSVAVRPIQETDTVDYMNGSTSVGTQQFTGNDVNARGASDTHFDASADVPSGYQLANGVNTNFGYDGQTHTVAVEPVAQPSPAPQPTPTPSPQPSPQPTPMPSPSPMPDVVTPSVPSTPSTPVEPSPVTQQSSVSSSVPSESARSSYVASSSYQPGNYVAPSASATPKKRSAKANVINIPSLDRHPYVKVGARDVRINPKAIKHARVSGIVQRGRKVAYLIKVGKVTGYVFGTAKRVPKTALMNGHKRAYVHVGRKTIKLTAKNLKHVRILKTVQKGSHVRFYVKINRKHGSVYARVSVKAYKFNIPKTYNTRYYRVLPKRHHYIKVVKPICIYRNYRFSNRTRRGRIHSGITVRVKRIIYNHGVTRFELTNGKFITANKGCVKII